MKRSLELKELIKELHGSVHQLQSEVQQLRHERPVVEVRKGVQLSPTIVGQIGGMDFRWVSNYRYILVMEQGMQFSATYLFRCRYLSVSRYCLSNRRYT